jgi:hypothetical protein
MRVPTMETAREALLGLAFDQAINSRKSFAGNVFLASRMSAVPDNGAIGVKSFITSQGSE